MATDPMMAKLAGCDPNESIRRSFGFGRGKDFTVINDTGLADLLMTSLPRTSYNYARDVGTGLDSNVIMAPTVWIMRNFTEAVSRVQSRTNKLWSFVEDHPLELLLKEPNEGYDGDALWKATVLSYVLDGNAYWRKVRNRYGEVIELWYVPHWLMVPRWPIDGSQFLSHYDYFPVGLGGPQRLAPRDVVHFRLGLDPRNTRLGMSQLRPLLREIFTDDEAANFSAKLLDNMGVPGLLVSPETGSAIPTVQQVLDMRAYLATAFSGDNKGKPMAVQIPTKVQQFGFDPNKIMVPALRDVAEERVCAMLGLPAAVVGFGSGLQSTKVGATMRELKKMSWVGCLNPMQKSLAAQATIQLLPDFVSQTRRFRVWFDTAEVSAFVEEDDARAARVARLVIAGILRVDKAQDELGLEVDDTQKVYLRPSNSVPVGPDAPAQPVPAGAVAPDPNAQPAPADGGAPADEPADPSGKVLAALAARGNNGKGHAAQEDE
jgi:HK97 family phage portal protein